MKELVLIPSEDWTLHGIVHHPLQSPQRRIGVVLFHENQNTKFGTHRLFVQLADALAHAGFYVLRYDDRGMCDSPGIRSHTFADRLAGARAALAFFRDQYNLEGVIGWGLCLGAAVALYCAGEPRSAHEKLNGLIICNILADPARVSRPEWGYQKVSLPQVAKDVFLRGNLLRKILNAPRNLAAHRAKLHFLATRYLHRQPKELVRLRKAITRVGRLLRVYNGPCLMIFSEKDTYLTEFVERVNPNDRLGLKRKKFPPAMVVVKGADHTFALHQKTAELIHHTVEWLQPFLDGCLPGQLKITREGQHGTSIPEVV